MFEIFVQFIDTNSAFQFFFILPRLKLNFFLFVLVCFFYIPIFFIISYFLHLSSRCSNILSFYFSCIPFFPSLLEVPLFIFHYSAVYGNFYHRFCFLSFSSLHSRPNQRDPGSYCIACCGFSTLLQSIQRIFNSM